MKINVRAISLLATFVIAMALATVPSEIQSPQLVQAASLNRAAVVIDTGTQVKTMCVGFSESSISGLTLLQRANGADAVIREFPGQGGAVCSLCGVGCTADSSCLTCGGSKYWAYSRQLSGTDSFRYWGAGAGSTQVKNGDIDGWKWGTGGSPPNKSFQDICPASQTSTTLATTPPTPNSVQVLSETQTNPAAPQDNSESTSSASETTAHTNSAASEEVTNSTITTLSLADASSSEGTSKKSGINVVAWALLIVGIAAAMFSFFRTRGIVERRREEDDSAEYQPLYDHSDHTPYEEK